MFSPKFHVLALLSIAAFSTVSAQDYFFRLYTNGGCDHASPANSTWPPNPGPANAGAFGVCNTAPFSDNFNRIETSTATWGIITYCNDDCTGNYVRTSGAFCVGPPAGCTSIRSTKVVPATCLPFAS